MTHQSRLEDQLNEHADVEEEKKLLTLHAVSAKTHLHAYFISTEERDPKNFFKEGVAHLNFL